MYMYACPRCNAELATTNTTLSATTQINLSQPQLIYIYTNCPSIYHHHRPSLPVPPPPPPPHTHTPRPPPPQPPTPSPPTQTIHCVPDRRFMHPEDQRLCTIVWSRPELPTYSDSSLVRSLTCSAIHPPPPSSPPPPFLSLPSVSTSSETRRAAPFRYAVNSTLSTAVRPSRRSVVDFWLRALLSDRLPFLALHTALLPSTH